MEWMEMLQQIFQTVLLPLLGILTTYAVRFLMVKADELKEYTEHDVLDKYIDALRDTVISCVIATNQTYVDALKGKDAFDKEAQQEAFQRTLNAVLTILSSEAKEYLTEAFGDLNAYITILIEQAVAEQKK